VTDLVSLVELGRDAYNLYSTASSVYNTGKSIYRYMSKRSYGAQDGFKAQRTVGGKVLRYNPQPPVAGSTRGRSSSALQRFKRSAGLSQRSISNLRVGGFMGIELKYANYARSALALAAPTNAVGGTVDPATILCLNGVAQGDGEQQRDGKQIHMKSLYVTGSIDIPALINQTTAKNIPTVYIALVVDKQTNGAQLTSELVFENPSGASTTAAGPLRNMQYTSRFEVLDSCIVELEQPQVSWDGTNLECAGSRSPFKLSWSGDMLTQFTGTGNTIASIQDTSMHLIAFAGPDLTAAPVISYNARLRFIG
jgi:hypothetical protein